MASGNDISKILIFFFFYEAEHPRHGIPQNIIARQTYGKKYQ
jgi:hypothetical protein